MNKKITKKEIEFLCKYYPIKGKMWCCKKLNRGEGSIRSYASKFNLRLDRTSEFYKEFQDRAAKSKVGKKRPEHSKLMKKLIKDGRLPQTFSKMSQEEKNKISEMNKKWIKENGHPRGMLGKKHKPETMRKVHLKAKEARKDPNNYVNSEQYRQMLSDKAKDQHRRGIIGGGYSRGKMGTYNINGKNIFFRSLWEANYALYLDFLIKQGEIKKWQFEVDTFWFEKIRRGVRSYKPDFKIFLNNGKIEYHEVKGWMDTKSKTKLKRMEKYYPEIKLIVIDEKSYKDIKSKIGKMLKFY